MQAAQASDAPFVSFAAVLASRVDLLRGSLEEIPPRMLFRRPLLEEWIPVPLQPYRALLRLIVSLVQDFKCSNDVRILRSEFLCFEQFDQAVLQVTRPAVNQTEILAKQRQSGALVANLQRLL